MISDQQSPRERLRQWVTEQGGTGPAAAIVGCHRTHLSHLLADPDRRPGIDVAFAIERATAKWSGGQIRAAEWAVARQPTGTNDC